MTKRSLCRIQDIVLLGQLLFLWNDRSLSPLPAKPWHEASLWINHQIDRYLRPWTKTHYIMGIICIDEKVWNTLLGKIETLDLQARQLAERYQPPTKEKWIDSQDVCHALSITKRTLQSYREKGIIHFSNVGGKFFYRESDMAAYLESRTKRKEA